MPTLTEDDKDSKLNPGQQHADSQFGSHDKIPGYDRSNDGLDGNDPFKSDTANNLLDRENDSSNTSNGTNSGNGALGFEQNFHSSNFTGEALKIASGGKSKSPIGWIIGIIAGAGIGLTLLASPSLLLVHLKETMTDKFNTQLSSLDKRTNKIMRAKVNGLTDGICGTLVSIKCKYSTMSDKQIAEFKSAGIEVETDGKTITGRNKPVSFKLTDGDGTKIPASEFSSARTNIPELEGRLKLAVNPKYIGFDTTVSDSPWNKLAKRFGLSKNVTLTGTNSDMEQSIADSTKNGIKDDGKRIAVGDKDPATGKVYTQENVDGINKITKELAKGADSAETATKKTLSETASEIGVKDVAKTGAKGLFNGLKVTGIVDTVCQAYTGMRTLGYAAKAVRAVQLARYALIFLSTADAIKGGTATAEQVSYLGTILTSQAVDANGVARGSATDSYGYNYAAYGDSGAQSSFTSRFLAGGGLAGGLIGFTSTINQYLGGKATTTCRTLANPFVGVGSALIGVVAAVFSGGISLTANEIAVASVSVVFSVAMVVLPILLKDIVAGNITKNLAGADSGDAITSGSGTLMGSVANYGGNAAMSKEDALVYNDLQTQTVAKYEKDEASKLSPFDPSNKYTFVGSIVSSLLPSISKVSSLSGSISSALSIVGSSVKSLLPTTNAISNEQYKSSLNVCQDIDYNAMGIATDPFCNVIYGIPPQYLDKDPLAVIDSLSGQINDVTGNPIPGSNYDKFITNCIERVEPLDPSTGGDCAINPSNADYYLRFSDQRIQNYMDGEDAVVAPTTGSATSVDTATIYQDSTSIACTAGTDDAGIVDGYHNKVKVPIRLCSIPGTVDTSTGSTAKVNSRMSANFVGLARALSSFKGVSTLSVNASFRTMTEQTRLYNLYGSKRASVPGTSNHQMGLAIDFQLSTNSTYANGSFDATKPPGKDAVYDWLTNNAATYGISKLKTEAWHWQTAGI